MSEPLALGPDVASVCFALPEGPGQLLSLAPGRLLRGEPVREDWPHFETADGRLSAGIWRGTPGAWRVDFPAGQYEFFTVLSGRGAVRSDSGETRPFGPGEAVLMPAGFHGVFEVHETVTKQYCFVQGLLAST